jgi:hypothetical protein
MLRFATSTASFVLAALLCFPASIFALERHVAVLGPDAEHDSWSQSTTATIRYYNYCTGWVWHWVLGSGGRHGTVFDASPSATLGASWALIGNGPGDCAYGFVGTISVHAVDAQDCPVLPPLASQPLCIPSSTTWRASTWGGLPVPDRFAVVVQTPYGGDLVSDHPGAGPTGPAACGLCFPATRTSHSYFWGSESSPICPGLRFEDGACDAELLIDVSVKAPVSVQSGSWGSIKALYR